MCTFILSKQDDIKQTLTNKLSKDYILHDAAFYIYITYFIYLMIEEKGGDDYSVGVVLWDGIYGFIHGYITLQNQKSKIVEESFIYFIEILCNWDTKTENMQELLTFLT